MIRGLERRWSMLALIKEILVFSWWYHWGKYNEIRKENTWDSSRGWVDSLVEFDRIMMYSFGMFMVISIVTNIYYTLWWLYGYSWIEFVTWRVWFIEFLRAKCNYYMRESENNKMSWDMMIYVSIDKGKFSIFLMISLRKIWWD